MNPVYKYLIAAAIVGGIVYGVVYGAYHHGVTVTTDALELKHARTELNSAVQVKDALVAMRDQDAKHAQAMADIGTTHQQDIDHEITSRDAVIAGLRAGSHRMRERFACPAAGERLPDVAAGTGFSDAAKSFGLQAEDGAFLISESSRADQIANQLRACQAVVRADRGQP